MLKGVNKLIIEVSNPESDFFERAIFFVKPEKSDAVTHKLNENVRSVMSKAGQIKTENTASTKKRTVLMTAGAAAAGAAIAGAVFHFIG